MQTREIKISARKSFFALTQEVATLLVEAQAEKLDVAIDDCLKEVGGYFNVDQVGLGQWTKSGKILPALRVWSDTPVSDYLNTGGPGPETYAYFCRKGSLIWNCLEDLEELPQFQEHCRQVDAVAGVFWLYHDFGSHTQQLAMGKANTEVWADDTVERLGALGGVLFNAYYRRQSELEVERLQRLERVVSNVAASLVYVPPDGVDTEVDKALRQIGETTDADLCTLLCADEGTATLTPSHEWSVDTSDRP